MPEKNIMQNTMERLMDLAEATSEGFVLAIAAAYMAGKEQGKKEAAA